MCQIMNLPQTGKVLTLCGWKEYRNPRVTRRSAPVVEVVFKNGYTVRCTPDHKFLTDSGWKSAEALLTGSQIQSTLTLSRSISMVLYTAYGLMKGTFQRAVQGCTEKFGNLLLGKSRLGIISTTGTGIQLTTPYQTLSVWRQPNTLNLHGKNIKKESKNTSLSLPEKKQLNGTSQTRGVCGIAGWQSVLKVGKNGSEKKSRVCGAVKSLMHSFASLVTLKSFATQTAKPLIIETIRLTQQKADVWCITVPEAEHFSLANGAVVHNCSDAFRYLALSIDTQSSWGKPLPITTKWIV
jgi:hypothetical protein